MFTDEQSKTVRAFVAKRRPIFVRQEYVESRRLEGEVVYDDRDARGFGAIMVYVQQGLADRFDDILKILRAIHAGQSGYHINYPVCLFSFGGDDGKLHHIGRKHDGEVRANVTAWAKELCDLAGAAPLRSRFEIPELLSWKNPVPGKRRVERCDLTVFICGTRAVSMSPEARKAFIPSVARNSVWAFLSADVVELELGTFVPSDGDLLASTNDGA